jgi:hypothetical protein
MNLGPRHYLSKYHDVLKIYYFEYKELYYENIFHNESSNIDFMSLVCIIFARALLRVI